MISLCAGNYRCEEDSSIKNQDCSESCKYVNQGGDIDQVWVLFKIDQYLASLR